MVVPMQWRHTWFVVSLHKVVEVREGQNTEMFDKFPYEPVEKKSFSLMYQHEGIA